MKNASKHSQFYMHHVCLAENLSGASVAYVPQFVGFPYAVNGMFQLINTDGSAYCLATTPEARLTFTGSGLVVI